MTIEQLGSQQVFHQQKLDKVQKETQEQYSLPMNKLFQGHNSLMTRILQDGIHIPHEELKKLDAEFGLLKKAYIGLDNQFVSEALLTQDVRDYVVFHTAELPVIIPAVFLNERSEQSYQNRKMLINFIPEKKWWETDVNKLKPNDFLKPALTCFSTEYFVKTLTVTGIEKSGSNYLPVQAIIFSTKWNLFTFLVFCMQNKLYFAQLKQGILAYLQVVKRL